MATPPAVTISNPLTLISSRSFSDFFGDFVLVGEVQNNTSTTLAFAKVTIQLYGPGGGALGSDFTYVYGSQNGRLAASGIYTDVLPPKAIGFFKIWTSIPASGVASHSFTSEGDAYDLSPIHGSLDAGPIALGPSYSGTSYSGTLRNAGPTTAYFAQVYLAGYLDGSINDVDFDFVSGTSVTTCSGITTDTGIRPAAQASFSSFFLRSVTAIGRTALSWDERGISPPSQSFGASGGSGTVNVVNVCSLNAASNVPWATVSLASIGNRDGVVSYSVAANDATVARTGTLSISGELFTISQAGTTPGITVRIVDVATEEGNSGTKVLPFTVMVSGTLTQPVTVSYATADGTANAGSDYIATSGTLTILPGEGSKTANVTILGDTELEADETFFVNLSNASGATIADAQGQGIITNDDSPPQVVLPTVSIDDRSVLEGAAISAAFRVFLSKPSNQAVTINYETVNGTAAAPGDYTATSGALIFSPGRTQHSIFVPIVSDTTAEGGETFLVNLSNPQGATLADAQAVGTIQDPPAAAKSAMYRSYNKSTDYHFFTTDLSSKNFAVGVLGFQDESSPIPFYVWNVQQSGTTPLFRMYNPNLGRHFYTASSSSRDFIMSIGGIYEKEEGFVYPLSTSPVPAGATELFLLYNNNSGTHLFTADANQKNAILNMFPGVWVQHTSVGYVFTAP